MDDLFILQKFSGARIFTAWPTLQKICKTGAMVCGMLMRSDWPSWETDKTTLRKPGNISAFWDTGVYITLIYVRRNSFEDKSL